MESSKLKTSESQIADESLKMSMMENDSGHHNVNENWAEYKIKNNHITKRSYHTTVVYKNHLYIHGGYDINKGVLKDFIKINLDLSKESENLFAWEEIKSNSKAKPGPLCRHSAVLHQNKMYLFGGQINTFESSRSLVAYDLEEKDWQKITPYKELNIKGLDSHTANLWNDKTSGINMIVFGGYLSGDNGGYSNSVYKYNFSKNEWETLFENVNVSEDTEKKLVIPVGRTAHASSVVGDNLYVFAGFDGDDKLRDMWSFHLINKTWTKLDPKGNLPESRKGHTMLNTEKYIILFGGFHDIAHEKNDVHVYEIVKNDWVTIEEEPKLNTTDVIHERSSSPEKHPKTKSKPVHGRSNKNIKLNTKRSTSPGDEVDSVQSRSPSNGKSHSPNREKRSQLNTSSHSPEKKNLVSNKSSAAIARDESLEKNKKKQSHPKQDFAQRSLQIQKTAMLRDLEPDVKTNMEPTPTTQSMKKLVSVLGFGNSKGTDYQHELQALDSARMIYMKNGEKHLSVKPGSKPCARDGHTAFLSEDKIYIFGGDRHKMSFNDLYVLSLEGVLKNLN